MVKKIILCTPRSGSTCAIKWLRKENNLYHTNHEEPFLNENPTLFLEKERIHGREYSYKIHVHQLTNYREWFINFYNKDEVLILKRRNLWKQFLSHLYQHENKWKLTWTTDYNILDKTPIEAKNYKDTIKLFFTWQQWLKKFDYDIIYYEDYKWNCSHLKFSNYIDYENYFINIKDIKRYYEIFYYWYKKGSWEKIERKLPDSLLYPRL